MTLFASLDATGWVVVVVAIGVVADRVYASIRDRNKDTLASAEKLAKEHREDDKERRETEYRRQQEERERARAEKVEEVKVQATTAAKRVDEVKTTLETTTDAAAKVASELGEKIDGVAKTGEAVHLLVNSAMSAQLKIAAIALRRIADLTRHPDDVKAADVAESGYQEHQKKQHAVDEMSGVPTPAK